MFAVRRTPETIWVEKRLIKMKPLVQISALMILLIFTGSASAADIRFGGILPGVTIVEKKVVSKQALKFTDIVKQRLDFSCGAAALATVLKFGMGKDVAEETVLQGMFAFSDPNVIAERGFSLLDMKKYTHSLGLKGVGYEVQFDALATLKIPVIVLLDLNGYKHFVVLRKVRDGRAFVGDPALGNRVMSAEAFTKSWNNIILAIVGAQYDPNGTLTNPPAPLSAKRLATELAPMAAIAQIGFGLEHTRSF